MNLLELCKIKDAHEFKTLASSTELGRLLFLSSENNPRIQLGNNRLKSVIVNSSGRLDGDSELLSIAIAANNDMNFVTGDFWEALERVYHEICRRYRRRSKRSLL